MTLGFSTHIKGKPTLFVEKILHCMHYDLKHGSVLNEFLQAEKMVYKTKNELIDTIRVVKPKKHTIRKDENNRWKAGNKIHFVIGNRTKQRFQFAPVVEVKNIQRIDIYRVANVYTPYSYKTKKNRTYQVAINGFLLNADEIHKIAINDGFDNVEDFFDWFNEDFNGKIIHWTDLKY